jgi:hypothetical protein
LIVVAYFPNGTAGIDFQQQWCMRCIHDVDENCPVWGAHLMYSYELCNRKQDPGKVILDMLIPDGGECALFVAASRLSLDKRRQEHEAKIAALESRTKEMLAEIKKARP